jgi:hypothetical protein
MKRTVQVYIEGIRLELFEDEKIEVNSSIQNIADISKVFTDFSQTFSVPTSPHNNEIFQHFYQNDVDSTIDYGIRRKAHIEVDLTFFRRGLMSIEKANLKKGSSESYSITFYGDVLTLKDNFAEDLLENLDYTSLNHVYSGSEVQARIENDLIPYDVRYPLISSNRVWQYQTFPPTANFPAWYNPAIFLNDDIYTVGGKMSYTELFPAVRISALFNLIQSHYGVTFQGTFLTDKRFTEMFLWYKNKDTFLFNTSTQQVDFSTITTPPFFLYNLTSHFDLTTNQLNINWLLDVTTHSIKINAISVVGVATYFIDVFQDGNLWQTLTGTTPQLFTTLGIQNTSGLNTSITFFVRATSPINITLKIEYGVNALFTDPLTGNTSVIYDKVIANTNTNVLLSNLNLSSLAPKIKVSEFFSGILKEFNLTCYPLSEKTYQIEPLEIWYQKGAIIDITKYTDVDSIDIERIKLFNKISFNYEQSESFLNKYYLQAFNKGYGDTTNQYIYDGGEFSVKVPFENLLFNRFIGTDLQVGYSLNEAMSPYVPKPVLMYKNSVKHTNFQFFDGTTTNNILNYIPFGQDLNFQNVNYTSNFGAENSTMLNIPIQQTLFATYYFPYLANLFNLKNRLTHVKTNLPISLLTGLRLNDRLIIRDKRYIINEMKSDLTSGDTDFVLLHDFRPMIPLQTKPALQSGDSLTVPIQFPNGKTRPSKVIQATFYTTKSGVVFTPTIVYDEQDIVIDIPPTTERFFLITESKDYLNTEDTDRLISEQGDEELITIEINYEFENGETLTNYLYINQ